MSLRPLRADDALLGDASSFPIGDTKFFMRAVNDRNPVFVGSTGRTDSFWQLVKRAEREKDSDEADQVISAFFLPIKHSSNPQLLSAFVDVCERLDGDKSIFGASVVVMSVRYAWKQYGRGMHRKSLIFHLLFLIVFMAATFVYGFLTQGLIDGYMWRLVNTALQILVLIGNSYFLFLEGVQMFNADASMLDKYDRFALLEVSLLLICFYVLSLS